MDKDELDVEKRLQDNITGGKLSFKDMSEFLPNFVGLATPIFYDVSFKNLNFFCTALRMSDLQETC